MISEELGFKLENATLADLGRAKRVVVDKDNTTIVDGKGKEDDIQGRIAEIKAAIEKTTQRLRPGEAAGAAGQARRRRGGDQRRRRDRDRDEGEEGPRRGRAARDARGGRRGHRAGRRRGAAPVRRRALDKIKGTEDEKIGVEIVRRALEEPIRMIAQNAGAEGSIVVAQGQGVEGQELRLQRRDRQVRGPGQGRASSTRPR